MYRDILTNRWVLGGIGFLIVLAVACVLWYQHDIAPDRKAAADADQLLRQSELSQVPNANSVRRTESSEKVIEDKLEDLPKTDIKYEKLNVQSDNQNQITEHLHTHDHEHSHDHEVPESHFGYGVYPEIPSGFPLGVSWDFPDGMFPDHILHQAELVDRVLIKLYSEGDREFIAGKWHKGKVYPIYPNTFYFEINKGEIEVEGQTLRTQTARIFGPSGTRDTQKRLEKALTAGKTIPGIRALDINSHGIDPYDYLQIK